VNWFGFDEKEYVPGGLDHAPLAAIVSRIQGSGVNSVRLPWANETLERNPVVPDYAVRANPQFQGKARHGSHGCGFAELARAHLMVILDNHVSRADWCCNDTDGNGLWYNAITGEAMDRGWQAIARRYRRQPGGGRGPAATSCAPAPLWGGRTQARLA